MRPLCDVDTIDQSTIGNISLKYNSIAHKNLIESDSTLLVIKLHLEEDHTRHATYTGRFLKCKSSYLCIRYHLNDMSNSERNERTESERLVVIIIANTVPKIECFVGVKINGGYAKGIGYFTT